MMDFLKSKKEYIIGGLVTIGVAALFAVAKGMLQNNETYELGTQEEELIAVEGTTEIIEEEGA